MNIRPDYINLADGSTWPRPAMEADEDAGVEWKLRHAPHTLTREDHMYAASVLAAYGCLTVDTNGERRAQVVRELRAQLTQEQSTRKAGPHE